MVVGLDVNRTRTAWLLGGTVLAGTVLFVLHAFVGTFVFGIFIYYATRPVFRRIKRRIGDRRIAAVVSLFVLALPLLLLFTYALAIGLQELGNVLEQYEGSDTTQLQQFLGPYVNVSSAVEDPSELLQSPGLVLDQPGVAAGIQALLDQGLGFASSVGGFIGNALLHLFIMIALAYYLLVDGHRLSRWFQGLFADDRGVVDQFVRDVDRDFENIFFGNILNAFITAVIGALVYSLLDAFLAPPGLNIPYAALVGLLTGAGSLVPVVGMKIVYVPVALWLTLVSIVDAGTETLWFPVVFILVSFLVVDVVPDLGLRPYVSGRHIHTGAVMLAYIFGPLLFGWYGLFLGPIILVLVVHFARVVIPELVAERRFAPFSVDPTYLPDLGVETAPVSGPNSGGLVGRPNPDGQSGNDGASDETAGRGASDRRQPDSESEPGGGGYGAGDGTAGPTSPDESEPDSD